MHLNEKKNIYEVLKKIKVEESKVYDNTVPST